MYTEATIQALDGLRDLTMIEWYVIPLLALVLYVYMNEVQKARASGDWNAIYAGLTIFGMDFINETWNGWVLHYTQHAAFWTTPGPTALRTMVGWNIEIMFMFAISGVIFYNTLPADRHAKVLGLPNRWFWAIGYAVFCVFVECLLNLGGHLVWEYPFWNLSFGGVWLIFLFGYFHFYVAALMVIGLTRHRSRIIAVSILWLIPLVANLVGLGLLGWRY